MLFAIFFGVLSKGTIWLEFKVVFKLNNFLNLLTKIAFQITYLEECAGEIPEIQIGYAEFVYDTPYNTVC